MDHAEFMSLVKRYYGPYENEFIEDVVIKHTLTFSEHDLDDIYKKLIGTIPRRENQNPVDVARLKSLNSKTEKNFEAEALDWWNIINRSGSSLDDVIISDIRVQACIEDMGGWGVFCQRETEAEHFHQAKFIKWFVMYSQNRPDREFKILRGNSSRRKTPLMFGDKQKCRQIMNMSPGGSEQYLQLTESMPVFLNRV